MVGATQGLPEYVRWAVHRPGDWMTVPATMRRTYERPGGGAGTVLEVVHQDGVFQIERVTMPAGSIAPVHRHPLIDTYECYLTGVALFSVRHRTTKLFPGTVHRVLPIPAEAWHSAVVGEEGPLVFLSIQRYRTDVAPRSVIGSWEVPA